MLQNDCMSKTGPLNHLAPIKKTTHCWVVFFILRKRRITWQQEQQQELLL